MFGDYLDHEETDGLEVVAPQLLISRTDIARLQCYINGFSGEISGLAQLAISPTELRIHSPMLLEQECTSATTDLDPESLGLAITELAQAGGDPSTLRCWWHSHWTMGTFWSETDIETIEMLAAYADPLVSIVGNTRGDWKARIDLFKPLRIAAHVELQVFDSIDEQTQAEIREEIAQKVQRRPIRKSTFPGLIPNNNPSQSTLDLCPWLGPEWDESYNY